MKTFFLISAIAAFAALTPVANAQSVNTALVGSWTGPYKADCADPNCQGQVFITIRSDGAGLIAKTVVQPSSGASMDRGEQPVVAEGSGWSVMYPKVTKVILDGNPTAGSMKVTLDARVNPDRLNAKPGMGTLSKK